MSAPAGLIVKEAIPASTSGSQAAPQNGLGFEARIATPPKTHGHPSGCCSHRRALSKPPCFLHEAGRPWAAGYAYLRSDSDERTPGAGPWLGNRSPPVRRGALG